MKKLSCLTFWKRWHWLGRNPHIHTSNTFWVAIHICKRMKKFVVSLVRILLTQTYQRVITQYAYLAVVIVANTLCLDFVIVMQISECILWLSIVFITILCTPQPTVVRWSSTQPVSTETMLQWKGFCALIANAYYLRGMAW